MDQIRVEAPHRVAYGPSERKQETGKAECGQRGEESSLLKPTSVGHSLERLRAIAKAM
jgi:hypothetical protein